MYSISASGTSSNLNKRQDFECRFSVHVKNATHGIKKTHTILNYVAASYKKTPQKTKKRADANLLTTSINFSLVYSSVRVNCQVRERNTIGDS